MGAEGETPPRRAVRGRPRPCAPARRCPNVTRPARNPRVVWHRPGHSLEPLSGARESRSFALNDPAVIVLAAGQGTRMKSRRAKVLHEICGVPMLGHVMRTARALSPARLIVVIGRDAEQVRERFEGEAELVVQAEQRGTGHAVMVAEAVLGDVSGDVLVLYGDTPLLRPETIERMRTLKRETSSALVMLTSCSENIPGRVVRGSDGRVLRVVEAQDASDEELAIAERNTGVYLFDAALLRDGLASLEANNEQGELYLTDVVGYAVAKGLRVEGLEVPADECLGINTRRELADAARAMRRRIVERHMDEGVSFVDPDTVYIDADVRIGRDSLIGPGVVITGDSSLGEGVHVKAGCMIESSRLGDEVEIGPSAHLRPGSDLGRGVKIGNFVEVKNSTLGAGTKAAHLGYIGDADVGAGVNFSCGAIVVNYDGYKKSRSEIGDGAFIGCNANLVSPVRVEPHGFVAAGSTVTRDVPEDALAISRDRQRNIEGWVARREGRAPPRPKSKGTEQGERVSASPSESSRGAGTTKSAAPRRAAAKKRTQGKATKKATGKTAPRKKAAKKVAKKKAAKKKAAQKTVRRKSPKKSGQQAGGKKTSKGRARR
ncbi:MAG: bifunctional UDP-N-acetylglucosamine diphosphorylase/glucosamine-1-phosphate N-acetyltransferase GlmU [Deltaproteobacteria bacterium]|nr:bifunctional UDP-N-acetylglucosamine diphosphorylase/glucosamine-1-phosphate N-acetyltransferase GlmU [Deltaproteobacteria bacterium]